MERSNVSMSDAGITKCIYNKDFTDCGICWGQSERIAPMSYYVMRDLEPNKYFCDP